MKRTVFFFSVLCLALFSTPLAHAHKAHEHDAAKMTIAVDGEQLNIVLESPLANLLSFEHAPVTLEQRRQAKEMARRMHQASTLFQLTPEAECRLEKVRLASEKLGASLLDPNIPLGAARAGDSKDPGDRGKKAAKEEHGDLDAEFLFMCAKVEKLNSVDILLFAAWPKLKKIEARAVTPKGQRAAKLTPKRHTISW